MSTRSQEVVRRLFKSSTAASASSTSTSSLPTTSKRRPYSSSSAQPLDSPPSSTSSPLHRLRLSSSSSSTTRQIGQPLPASHPHLFPAFDKSTPFPSLFPKPSSSHLVSRDYHESLKDGRAAEELSVGITRGEYEERRKALMEGLEEGAVVIVMGGRIKYMSGQIFYRFRQSSPFFYLTGFLEPDAALVLEKNSSGPRGFKMTMFVPPHDQSHEVWNGPRCGSDGAVRIFGADEGIDLDPEGRSLLTYLKKVLPQASRIYHDPALPPTIPRKSTRTSSSGTLLNYLSPESPSPFDLFSKRSDFDSVLKLLSDPKKALPLSPILDKQRLIKSPSELRLMRRAGQIAALAHNSTMAFSNTPVATTEWALQSHFEYTACLLGATRSAYVPVVAGGDRGCTIHYTENDHPLSKGLPGQERRNERGEMIGELVTMDAGIEYAGYTSDITRAWPVASSSSAGDKRIHFTTPQLHLYEILLRVLKGCIKLCTEDLGYSLGGVHRQSVEMLRTELKDLGWDMRGGELERVIYPHYLGHNLGLDLHDTPSVPRSTPLRKAQTVTIEPGLYIPPLDSNLHRLSSFIPKEFRGIGLRIEDDIVVGEREVDGPVILSAEAVREVEDVRAVCEGRVGGVDEVERHLLARGERLGFDDSRSSTRM